MINRNVRIMLGTLILLNIKFFNAHAQKPMIDSNAYNNWITVDAGEISDCGNYVTYHEATGNTSKLIIKATAMNWSFEQKNLSRIITTHDDKLGIFLNNDKKLEIITLGTNNTEIISSVQSYQLVKSKQDDILLYKSTIINSILFCRTMNSGSTTKYQHVHDYVVNAVANALILYKDTVLNGTKYQAVNWIDLAEKKERIIWQSPDTNLIAGKFVFGNSGTQLAFKVFDKEHKNTVFYKYTIGAIHAEALMDGEAFLEKQMPFASSWGFSKDGKYLLLNYKNESPLQIRNPKVHLTVWGYHDTTLQSYQRLKESDQTPYLIALDIQSKKLTRLNNTNEVIIFPGNSNNIGLIIPSRYNGASSASGDGSATQAAYLFFMESGCREQLNINGIDPAALNLSPEGKYLIYYDANRKNYFSYEVATKTIRNLTKKISGNWTIYQYDNIGKAFSSYNIAGWLPDDAGVLLHDQFDIWQVDPTGLKAPVNLTNGYGLSHHIFFDIIPDGNPIRAGKKMILSAFDVNSKANGFYVQTIGKKTDPQLLTMNNCLYYAPPGCIKWMPNTPIPVRAKNSERWLVRKMDASSSPNYFTTTDFKNFSQVTSVYPEHSYNWYTTELKNFKAKLGQKIQGVLYKPENFDFRKKYPVIIHYYEIKSNALHAYQKPEPSEGDLNISWYVSHGYLVFEPDIHYQAGKLGKCALNSVEGAYHYLANLPFVNPRKIGVQGHSLGGIETNYIVTHTNVFAAACSASSISDYVSAYGSLFSNGESMQDFYENLAPRMGNTLWQRPDLYIENSSVFNVDKVTTPLLLEQGKNDQVCPFPNTLEFFLGLRRLHKKAWLLEYEDATHSLFGKEADDFDIRMAQFFDHYLKDAPPPKWMTQGIAYRNRGTDDGLSLDLSGRKP